jgi:hypothetical protein
MGREGERRTGIGVVPVVLAAGRALLGSEELLVGDFFDLYHGEMSLIRN